MTLAGRLGHGLVGAAVLLLVAYACSADRRAIRPRVIATALALQVAIGAMVLFVPPGRALLGACARGVALLLGYGQQGANFVFGGLGRTAGFTIALDVLPQIVFIAAIIELLFFLGILRRFADAIGAALSALLGLSRVVTFTAVITVFLGQSEIAIAIRPAVGRLTRAELFTAMSSGLASIAGSVLAGYAGLGIPLTDLLAASFMAIPGGLLFANMLLPEREHPDPAPLRPDDEAASIANVFEAVATGAARGLRIAVLVGATLLAFTGLIALGDGILGGLGDLVGLHALSFERVFGFLFAPVALLIGVGADQAVVVGQLIGEKLVFNEFLAYVRLVALRHAGTLAGARATGIATFALCGFANFSSVAIVLASFGAVDPRRRPEIARLALRAVLAGTLSNLMSASIAGLFIAG